MSASESGSQPYILPMDRLESFYDEPGERGWIMEGHKHGFSQTTVITTQTAPFGGPPLHTHNTEEIHVLPKCRMAYVIEGDFFEVEGPCMINIPALASHTFLNIGEEPANIVCFWPHNEFWTNYEEIGPNPLLARYGVVAG